MRRADHRTPTITQLKRAHSTFADKEARDLFYRVATELVDRAFKQETQISVGESIAVLLATWNRRFYQRGRRCDRRHVDMIDEGLEGRQVLSLALADETILAGTDDGIFTRGPQATSWTRLPTLLDGREAHPRVTELLALPRGQLLAATLRGVLVSPDAGRTWTVVDGTVQGP